MRQNWHVRNESSGEVVFRELELANTYFSRLKGLQFRKSFPQGKAILLVPCSSIHTHWVRFPIDVAMVDKHGVVLKYQQSVKPWKFVTAPANTYAIFEWIPGSATIKEGERLRVIVNPPQKVSKVPKNLGYLYCEAA